MSDGFRDRLNDHKKELDAVKVEVAELQTEVSTVKQDTALIRLHVTNHIPHILAEVKEQITALEAKIAPIETKHTKSKGVQEFLSGLVKVCVSIATATWAVLQIIKFLA